MASKTMRCNLQAIQRFLTLLVGVTLHMAAHAGAYCDGKISDIHVRRSGDVSMFSVARNSYMDVCNLNANRGEPTPAVCKGWLTLLLTANAQQRDVSLFYESYNSRAEVPANASAPAPFQVMSK